MSRQNLILVIYVTTKTVQLIDNFVLKDANINPLFS